jgi:hypothetical protein
MIKCKEGMVKPRNGWDLSFAKKRIIRDEERELNRAVVQYLLRQCTERNDRGAKDFKMVGEQQCNF